MEPILVPIIVGIAISSISGAILAFMNRRWKKKDGQRNIIKENMDAIIEMRKAIWRLNKTVLIMAKLQDDQTAKNHPELTSNLEDIATELLESND